MNIQEVGHRNLGSVIHISKSVVKKLLLIMKQLRMTIVNLLRSYLVKTLILNKSETVDKTALHRATSRKTSAMVMREQWQVLRTLSPGWLFLNVLILQERLRSEWREPASKMFNQCMQCTCHYYANKCGWAAKYLLTNSTPRLHPWIEFTAGNMNWKKL